jgi:RNA ligase (TIGR02306 family)
MRKLVTVRRISAITPILGADFIDRATIDGWKCVVKKDQFQVGDLCVYFEIDAFLPQGDSRYEVLMKNLIEWEGMPGIRIKTMRFRKQTSQGLALPLNEFPEISSLIVGMDDIKSRQIDFADVLGIQKWERPIPAELMGQVSGALPTCIRRTDEERIQNCPELLVEQADELFEETIKLDGFSMTVFKCQEGSGVGSKNWWFAPGVENTYTRLAQTANLLTAVRDFPGHIAIQGELVGPGICKNPDRLSEKQFRLFTIQNLDTASEIMGDERETVIQALRSLGAVIHRVPISRVVRLADLGTLEDLLAHANGPSLNPDVSREGLVYKRTDGEVSFKVISNEFLLTHEDT